MRVGHTEFQIDLREEKNGKRKGRRRAAKTQITYAEAAKKANNHVLGSVRASMNLTHHTI
jgi:hypothetical protein